MNSDENKFQEVRFTVFLFKKLKAQKQSLINHGTSCYSVFYCSYRINYMHENYDD